MQKIKITFAENFWPSGRGETIGFVEGPIENIARCLRTPVLCEDGAEFVLLYFEGLGPVSICIEESEDTASVVVDSAADPYAASTLLDSETSGKLNFIWPSGLK